MDEPPDLLGDEELVATVQRAGAHRWFAAVDGYSGGYFTWTEARANRKALKLLARIRKQQERVAARYEVRA